MGHGVQAFLQQEGVIPERLAYDRPSPKFLHFLAKYFGKPIVLSSI